MRQVVSGLLRQPFFVDLTFKGSIGYLKRTAMPPPRLEIGDRELYGALKVRALRAAREKSPGFPGPRVCEAGRPRGARFAISLVIREGFEPSAP
jgi:hypothetical protein